MMHYKDRPSEFAEVLIEFFVSDLIHTVATRMHQNIDYHK